MLVVNVVNGQEFFTGSKSPTASISRTGSTIFGNVLLRAANNVQVLEHTKETGDFYIRSVAYQVPNDNGNLILNDIGGFVGIGTSRPKEKLSVNGNIRAREIKVEIANWPDYVFRKDYELKPLSEVERYINENGHLPEIPKAEDVENEGVSLGEMNKLLLKKVEELTLHLIEKEKNIEGLKQELKNMRKELFRVIQIVQGSNDM
ncbi:hypothetical protein C5745_18830 [Sphingobacterium haloxyli]|uniref:Peptidase S74 domain-containing protein n=2 Tax=Sphingobacterium haloxyli TaxID=2100533 RepID=A0A2S9IWR2_9SPHI|nr:hypothetical protein C5745_18830 [Sphingobacterium haloxyli]